MEKKINSQINSQEGWKDSSQMVKRLIDASIYIGLSLAILIYLFTKEAFYSIIFLLGTVVSISGFYIMIKMIDRILGRGKVSPLYFLVALLKMMIIAAVFYLVSRVGESAVLFHILGLSVIVMAIFMEAAYQLYRSITNDRP